MARLYTRSGDRGETGLADRTRVRKDDARIRALGSLDECNAQLGLLLAQLTPGQADLCRLLAPVQHHLFELGAGVAGAEMSLAADDVAALESAIDDLCARLPPLRRFVLPGGDPLAAQAQVARAVCRRAERDLVAAAAAETPDLGVRYLNRLSDLLFAVARTLAVRAGGEVFWEPRARR